jgi:hypothetical protein
MPVTGRKHVQNKERKNLGGRPLPIEDDALFENRDRWLGLLSQWWGEVGWPLRNAITPERVREALARIRTTASADRAILEPFLFASTTASTALTIRSTQRNLKAARARENKLVYRDKDLREQFLNRRVNEGKAALGIAWRAQDPDRERVRDEYVRRVHEWAAFRRDLKACRDERAALENTLKEQEASYAQQELSAFIRKQRHAHSPRSIARAIAGLPCLSASYSYRRCGGHMTARWPTFQFWIFEIIKKAWRDRRDRSSAPFLNRLQRRVRAIQTVVGRNKKPDHYARGVQHHVAMNWRYLKQAVEATDLKGAHAGEVPYLVLANFAGRIANATSPTERVLAAAEQLDLTPPPPPKRKRR